MYCLNIIKVTRTILLILVMAMSASCGGGGGNTTPLANTTTPLFTSAPSTITLAPEQTSVFTVGGGGGGQKYTTYSATSGNTKMATVLLTGTSFSITGVAIGSTTIVVQDAAGATVNIIVTVNTSGTSNGGALFIAAPTAVSISQGQSATYTIGGGTGTYTVASSDKLVTTVTLAGTTITVAGISQGTANIVLFDGAGTSVKLAVNVAGTNGAQAFYTTTPTPLVLISGATPSYTIFGGVPPYTIASANAAVVNGTINNNSLTLTGLAQGAGMINLIDSIGAIIPISVTVVSSGTLTPLYTTAPATVIVGNGKTANYAIGGGTAPYTVSSGNTEAISATILDNLVTIKGLMAGSTSQIAVFDSTGTAIRFSASVSSDLIKPALYTTSPSSVTLVSNEVASYVIGGGTAPYTVASSASKVVTTSIIGNTFKLSGVGAGIAQIVVVDSLGVAVNIAVTVGTSSIVTPLYSSAPSSVVVGAGKSSIYMVGGGTGPYTVSSSNAQVATTTLIGTQLTVNGLVAGGSSTISIVDANGTIIRFTATISSGAVPAALYTTSPTSVTIGVGANASYTIGGGMGPFTVTSSNIKFATVLMPTATSFNITGVAAGTLQIIVIDSLGVAVIITVTVP